jgi:hypothetical protein
VDNLNLIALFNQSQDDHIHIDYIIKRNLSKESKGGSLKIALEQGITTTVRPGKKLCQYIFYLLSDFRLFISYQINYSKPILLIKSYLHLINFTIPFRRICFAMTKLFYFSGILLFALKKSLLERIYLSLKRF